MGRVGQVRHALCAPAREVGDEDVALGKVQIRFVQNPPAAGAARAAVKRATDSFTEARRSSRVSTCRPRLQAKLARDRADAALLHRGEVGGGCRLARGVGHGAKVSRLRWADVKRSEVSQTA